MTSPFGKSHFKQISFCKLLWRSNYFFTIGKQEDFIKSHRNSVSAHQYMFKHQSTAKVHLKFFWKMNLLFWHILLDIWFLKQNYETNGVHNRGGGIRPSLWLVSQKYSVADRVNVGLARNIWSVFYWFDNCIKRLILIRANSRRGCNILLTLMKNIII